MQRKKSWLSAMALTVALCLPLWAGLSAHAAEPTSPHATEAPKPETHEKEAGILDVDLGTPVFTILIFLTLLLILRFTAWKPILSGLQNREQAIRDGIEAANKAREDAARATKEFEAKIAEAQRQGALALAQAKQDALKLAEGIRTQAEAESLALKDRAMRDIEAAKQQAVSEINAHAADLGIAIAGKILQRSITVTDQDRLVQESLSELKPSNN